MRTPFLAANWKMHKTVAEAVIYAKLFSRRVADYSSVEITLAPPFTAVGALAESLSGTLIQVAGQDLYCEWDR